jgi:dUTP pyrophosphatase
MSLEILIKYFDPNMPKLSKIDVGDWVDLRNKNREVLLTGVAMLISLGIAMKLPPGYEAIIAPRSSTFKTWGAIQTNSLGIVDESYCGDEDEWKWTAYPTRDSVIEPYSRICQFRIQLKQPDLVFKEVFELGKSRGGFGSTGIK